MKYPSGEPRKIIIDSSTESHISTHTFYINRENILTDVYLSSTSKNTRAGFADFLPLHCVDKDVMKAFEIMLEEE
jgi:S-adenosylmethionine/arginine decarboxylase-like enzyme